MNSNFRLSDNRYLFSDIFLSGDEIVFISMVYPDIKVDFKSVRITINGLIDSNTNAPVSLYPTTIHMKEVWESSVIVLYKHPLFLEQNRLEVSVTYKNIVKKCIAKRYDHLRNDKLVMMTLFKDDHYLISAWIEYYKRLGIQHFYMYYNGSMNERNRLSTLRYDPKLVTFIEWNYQYWLDKSSYRIVDPKLRNNYHHAQTMAIHSAIYRYRHATTWMGLFDLDEYAYISNDTGLIGLVDKYDPSITSEIYLRNSWATAEVSYKPLRLPDLAKSTITYDKRLLTYPEQAKNIINPRNVYNFGIHQSHIRRPDTKVVDSGLFFFHFYKFSPKNRTEDKIALPATSRVLNINIPRIKHVVDSDIDEVNGQYTLLPGLHNDHLIYKKDDDSYYIYWWDKVWRVGIMGVKCITTLNNFDIYSSMHSVSASTNNSIEVYQPRLVEKKKVIYTYAYKGNVESFYIQFDSIDQSDVSIYLGIEGIVGLFVRTKLPISSKVQLDRVFYNNIKKLYPNAIINAPLKDANTNTNTNTNKSTISSFTLGVDSFYTLLTEKDRLDAIMFTIGFDVGPKQHKLITDIKTNLNKVAKQYGKKLILCQTDLKPKLISKAGCDWASNLHGPALFCIFQLLSSTYQHVLIPSTHPKELKIDYGSSFRADPHFSSSRLNIRTHGDLNRIQKIERILRIDPTTVLQYLRVCWLNPNQVYNCSKCDKCLRTMVAIQRMGMWRHAITFDRNRHPDNYYKLKYVDKGLTEIKSFITGQNRFKWEEDALNSIYREIDDIGPFLKQYVSDHANKQVVYFPNIGNAGDSLIAHATVEIFDSSGIKYKLGKKDQTYENSILIYGGGGNFVRPYTDCKNFLTKHLTNGSKGNKLLILPHTIRDYDEVIRKCDDNVTIICREKVSYDYCFKLMTYKSRLYLSKDMALYLRPDVSTNTNTNKTLNAYRTDCEKTNIKIPADNVDVSLKFQDCGFMTNLSIAKTTTDKVFAYLAAYDVIKTNRLHIAIAGALLGKQVQMHSNSYYKNKAVYDYSLKHMANITFV